MHHKVAQWGFSESMSASVSQAFMKLSRRAESNERTKLVETFVDVGPLFSLLSSVDHQIMYGRRGTGKTHALLYLSETARTQGDIAIYIDMRILGSSSGTYNDETISLAVRASRLLIDTLNTLYDGLFEWIVENEPGNELSVLEPLLDRLSASIPEVKVSPLPSREFETPGISHTVHFGSFGSALRNLTRSLNSRRIWILLDEWSSVPLGLQPYLADLVRRSILAVQGITIKIAAIEQRSRFKLPIRQGEYTGIEVGADIAADINLDDFMVFDNDAQRATLFFKDLLYKHYQAVNDDNPIKSPNDLVREAFTQSNVFDEFVRAAEGVPRDSINIAILAAQKAMSRSIAMDDVRSAARNWYQRDKGSSFESSSSARNLLHWIIDEVIGQRKARAFLLRKDVKHELIDYLFDGRVLHILKRNISTHEQPGIRYDVYKLDYGCYVDLINTIRSPQNLLPGLNDLSLFNQDAVEVPQDDYRTIRRAILDLDKFEASNAMKDTSTL